MRDWFKHISILLVSVVIIAGVLALAYHQWSDCLEENSVITCMRMLN